MELIYLWVDGYRNLNNFGTPLNGAYEIEMHLDESKVENIQINIKKVKSPSVFSQNLNIISIVGKNGAGKSNICNSLAAIIRKHCKESKDTNWNYFDFTLPKRYCLIYRLNNEFKYVCYGINCEIKLPDENLIQFDDDDSMPMCALFLPYLNLSEDKVLEFPKYHIHELINIVKTNNYFYYDRFRVYDTSHALRELFDITQKNNIDLFENYENYVFKYYGYEFNIEEEFQWLNLQLNEIQKRLKKPKESHVIQSLIESNEEIVKLAQECYFKQNQHSFKVYVLPQACFSYALFINPSILLYASKKSIEKSFFNKKLEFDRNPNFFIDIYHDTIKNFKQNSRYQSLYTIDKYVNTSLILNKYIKLEENIQKAKNIDFLNKLTTYDGNLFKLENDDLVSISEPKENVEYITFLDELKVFRLNYYNEDYSNKASYSFINLSSGEQRKLRFLADFISVLKNKINTILIDEIDMSWHPEWQRKFIYYIDMIVKALDIKEQLNVIVTTHSPFILSDMPQENVILLDKNGDTGLCEIKQSKTKTFGSNIHTLFANSFFMQSTIGQFADKKIKEAAKFLQNKDSEFKNISEVKQFIKLIDNNNIFAKILSSMYELKNK